ncbi:hypothetical protein B0H21DRAFT_580209 [Amylocystis lapponica]|nr:hypothetical protein B0H21DRAFT_580209 [Amylocystis lapponica]
MIPARKMLLLSMGSSPLADAHVLDVAPTPVKPTWTRSTHSYIVSCVKNPKNNLFVALSENSILCTRQSRDTKCQHQMNGMQLVNDAVQARR